MTKTNKFQFNENLRKGGEEVTLVAVIVAAFFSIHAMNKMEPKTIIINQTAPAPAAPKPEDTEAALPKVSSEGEQIKLEVPSNSSSDKKSHDRLAEVPKIPLLPTPLTSAGKVDYQNLINQTKRPSARQDKSSIVIQRIAEEKEDDGGAGVHVVLRNKNTDSTETEPSDSESEAVNVIIGSKEKSHTAMADAPDPKPKDNPAPETNKSEEVKKPDSAPVKLQEESPVANQTDKAISSKNPDKNTEAKSTDKK